MCGFIFNTGATKPSYTCNANDIGSVIKVELESRDVPDCKVTAEIGPVKVEPAIGDQVKKYLAKLDAEFEVGVFLAVKQALCSGGGTMVS